MNVVVFEDEKYVDLLPLTWLRPACELRCGRDRLLDKVRRHLASRLVDYFVRPELRTVVSRRLPRVDARPQNPTLLVNSRLLLRRKLKPPSPGTAWVHDGELLAATIAPEEFQHLAPDDFLDPQRRAAFVNSLQAVDPPKGARLIRYHWDLIAANARLLGDECAGGGLHEGRVDPGVHMLDPERITIAPGARIKPGVVLDAEDGPIWIDRDVVVQPGCVLTGPCYIGPGSLVKAQTVIHPGVSAGPVCKLGGEIAESIFLGYSNKQHDGFLGHSYVAMWVNIGADTVTSDLKNTYGTIRVALNGRLVESGQQFVGTCFGDHAKTGIGTILPTGCVIGVAANVFTQNGVPKFVPSFAWLTNDGMSAYRVEKAVEIAALVMQRRQIELSPEEADLLRHVARQARDVEHGSPLAS